MCAVVVIVIQRIMLLNTMNLLHTHMSSLLMAKLWIQAVVVIISADFSGSCLRGPSKMANLPFHIPMVFSTDALADLWATLNLKLHKLMLISLTNGRTEICGGLAKLSKYSKLNSLPDFTSCLWFCKWCN